MKWKNQLSWIKINWLASASASFFFYKKKMLTELKKVKQPAAVKKYTQSFFLCVSDLTLLFRSTQCTWVKNTWIITFDKLETVLCQLKLRINVV